MQYDKIYEIKENKKYNNLKTQNLITSTQSKVPNNTKNYQFKVEMQENIKKNPPKMKKKKNERERERKRNNLLCIGKLCI